MSASSDIVTVSGLPGSGTSTVCQLIGERTGWVYLNTGDAFRQMAAEAGISLPEFGSRAEDRADIDRELDARMVRETSQIEGGVILEGRVTGWMARRHAIEAVKVWMEADIQARAERVAQREGQSREEALLAIRQREQSETRRYADHHGIDITDLTIYDLVIDSMEQTPHQIADRILAQTR